MPDLLLELLSEEIPARMQARAAEDLKRLVTGGLMERGFMFEAAQCFSTPRRLTLHIVGLPARGRDVREERKGPRVGAPDAALAGFLKSAGLGSREELGIQADPKKGDFYVATIARPGRDTAAVLTEVIPDVIGQFPWPKSMRWGAASAQAGSLRWVRPLQSILCTFGDDTEMPEIVPFIVGGIASGDLTCGHRFMAPGDIQVQRFDDYVAALEAAKVVLDPARRRDIIRYDARDLAFAQGLEVIDDDALLEEVGGLVEWPVVLMGHFDEAFLDIPPEAIRATIRANQKCFVLRGTESAALADRFILVSNIDARDDGAAIVAGNERVVRARLSDAKFFWDTDRRVPLERRLEKLQSIVFHEKLGTQAERVERIAALARELAPVTGADAALAERAARLAKADLTTEMVGEFPELQGLMGRYYAAAQGEHPSVAAAIEDHYRPAGPSDRVPTDPVSVAVALADKLDTLVGFWAIDEKPTGSKDPYALRRAGLGVIRLVLENGLRLPLLRPAFFASAMHGWCSYYRQRSGEVTDVDQIALKMGSEQLAEHSTRLQAATKALCLEDAREFFGNETDCLDLLSFCHDRLKVHLRDRGARHDLIDAVLSPGIQLRHAEEQPQAASRSMQDDAGGVMAEGASDDLLMVVRRVEALGRFLDTEDGANLLAGTKRAANILRIEEKKDGRSHDGAPEASMFVVPEEASLSDALAGVAVDAATALRGENFEGAMVAIARLRPSVDAFFDKVTVNDADASLRDNRLRLLSVLRRTTSGVADFSKIER